MLPYSKKLPSHACHLHQFFQNNIDKGGRGANSFFKIAQQALNSGGPGGPDPCPFFKRAKVPFSGERLCEMKALLICI